MKKNLTLKIFLAALVLTFITFGVSAYSINKIVQDDPNIGEKIEVALSKKYDLKNFHISISKDSTLGATYTKASDVWKFDQKTKKIDIKTISADIDVLVNKDETFLIKAQGSLNEEKSKRLLDVDFSEKKLVIREPEDSATKNLEITIYLPKSFNSTLEVATISGEIAIEKNSLDEIKLSSISGDMNIEENSVSAIEVETVSGDLKIGFSKKHEPYQFKIKTLSGEVTNSIEESTEKGKLLSVQTVSGNVKID